MIDKLIQLNGPDRKIDEELFFIAHGRKRNISTFEQYQPSEELPYYTESLDAALTLVPECFDWQVHSGCGAQVNDISTRKKNYADGANPAIALCIAALKARVYE